MNHSYSERRKFKIYWSLYPFSLLYGAITSLRNRMFDCGILTSESFPMPVISIGNISVGGTGKTPHTEYLIRLLQEEYNVAVLSRGYKRKTCGFVVAHANTTIDDIGDEPYQMAQKFKQITVAVEANRRNGIKQLTTSITPCPEVILLDDAYQHRYVKPGLSLLLIDYNRPIDQDCMLPAGRLRETQSGKKRADIIIVTKCPEHLSLEEEQALRQRIAPLHHQSVFFTHFAYCHLVPLFGGQQADSRPLSTIDTSTHVLLVTGIASPTSIIKELNKYTNKVDSMSFADHHDFSTAELQRIAERFEKLSSEKKLMLTTEKDAARLIHRDDIPSSLRPYIYVLPVEVEFSKGQADVFNTLVTGYVARTLAKEHLQDPKTGPASTTHKKEQD